MNLLDTGSTPILSCEQAYLIPNAQQCQFVRSQCADHPGLLNSFSLYYCIANAESTRHWLGIPLLVFLLLVLFGSIGLVAGNALVPNLSAITSHLKIPENISGLTLLAFANGSPDIISTYTSFKTGNTMLAFGEIIGAAYFINSVVIGIIFIIKPFDIIPDAKNIPALYDSDAESTESSLTQRNAMGTYIRDVLFFAFSIAVLLYCVRDGLLTRSEMMVLVGIYVTYVCVIIVWQWYFDGKIKSARIDTQARGLYDATPNDSLLADEFEDSYNYNPQLIRNLEFETILSGLTTKSRVGYYIARDGRSYRDSEDSEERIELNQIQAELIQPPCKTTLQKMFDFIALPAVTLFRYTIPMMTVTDFEGDYKPSLAKLLQLLSSLLISPFLIMFTLFPDTATIWKCLLILPTAGMAYTSYHNLIQSSNPSTLVKCAISAIGVFASISWISIIVSEIINVLTLISSLTYIRPSAIGITVFALGNSVGDMISCIVISRMGYPLMALAACIGGPLLNILLGLGLNGLLIGNDHIEIATSVSIIFCLLGLLFNLIVVLLIFIPLGGWRCDRYVGTAMILLWLIGVSVAIVLEVLVTY